MVGYEPHGKSTGEQNDMQNESLLNGYYTLVEYIDVFNHSFNLYKQWRELRVSELYMFIRLF